MSIALWRRACRRASLPALAGLLLAGCQGYDYDGVADVAALIDDGDRLAMVETAQRGLENNRVGQSSNWSNPESGHLGTVTPTPHLPARAGPQLPRLPADGDGPGQDGGGL